MIIHWLTTLLFLALFLILLKKSGFVKNETISFRILATAFIVKVVCGILYGYFDRYSGLGGDSMNYFNDANWMYQAFASHPGAYFQMLTGINDTSPLIQLDYYRYLVTWKTNEFDYFFNDSRTIVRIHAFIRLFSFGNYNVHVIVFTFLSFIGQLLIYKTFRKYISLPASFTFLLVCFAPSSLVWFSGIMKEPIVIFGIGLLLYALQKSASAQFTAKTIAGILFAVLLLLMVRFYVLLCMLPGAILLFWLTKRPPRALLKTSLVYLTLLLTALSFDYFASDYKVSQIVHDQLMNFVKKEEYFNPGTRVEFTRIHPNLADLIVHSPAAFLKTLAAPVHKIFSNPYRFIFFAENILVLLLTIFMMLHFRKISNDAIPMLAFSLSFILMLYILIGLTTPFEGAIIRFRSLALPFVFFVLLSFTDRKKLESNKIFHNLVPV